MSNELKEIRRVEDLKRMINNTNNIPGLDIFYEDYKKVLAENIELKNQLAKKETAEKTNKSLCILGSMSAIDTIDSIANYYVLLGNVVIHKPSKGDDSFGRHTVIHSCFEHIKNADEVIVVKNDNGSMDTNTLYEIEFARQIGAPVTTLTRAQITLMCYLYHVSTGEVK